MTTTEKNTLIAEFMGWDTKGETRDVFTYHTSWDSIMPVLRKIQSLTEEPEDIDHMKDAFWMNSIEYLHTDIVDWIIEYNQNKQA